ncbi:type II secretion system F family protein [bacterium]|nr:type II secretion system F family protein [bacterium]
MHIYKAKSQFYNNMISTEKAGVLLSKALRLKQPKPFDRIGPTMATLLENGEGKLSELMGRYPSQFTQFERQLIAVGETSGKLETIYASLSQWFSTLSKIRTQIISSLAYPIFLYHLICALLPTVAFFQGKSSLTQCLTIIGVLSIIPYLFIFLIPPITKAISKSGNSFIAGMILLIPFIGKTLKKFNYALFFNSFGITLNSGINIKRAIELSASSCSNTFIGNKFKNIGISITNNGSTFVQAFTQNLGNGELEQYAMAYMETAETTGNVGDMATQLGNTYLEESEKEIKTLATIGGFLIFVTVAIYIGYEVVSFWTEHQQDTLNRIGG